MTYTIGEARIKVPDRISRGDLITVNSIVSHPMDTGFFRTPTAIPSQHTSSSRSWSFTQATR